MKDVNINIKIDVEAKSIQRIQDTLKLGSYINNKIVVDASITSEEKKDEDTVYEVEVINIRFKDGSFLKMDEEGSFILDTGFLPIMTGRVPSELYGEFKDIVLTFLDYEEEKVNEFIENVNISIEEKKGE